MSNLKKSIRKSLVVGGFCMMSSLAMSAQISLTLENKSTRDVIREIERVSEYRFFYNEDLQGLDQKTSINTNDANIQTVLNEIQRQTSIRYVIKENNQIVLSAGVKSNKTQQVVDNRIIKGTILDATGMPVIGANVMVKGTTNGTITDMDGKFSLEVDKNAILVVSYIGYANQEIKVGNQNTLSITMKEDAEALDEVVVIGYGTTKRKDFTGSVSSVKMEDSSISLLPNMSALESVKGNVPGLDIGATNTAGGEPSTLVRGQKSISGNNSPLLVVDGVIFMGSINDINPNDIASFDILKDATSAAAYGSRSANGVIIITTKKGKIGKPTISLNATGTMQTWLQKPELMNGDQFVETIGLRLAMSEEDVLTLLKPQELANREAGREIDWLDESTRTGWIQDYQVAVSGAGEKMNYYFSTSYSQNQGVVVGDDYDRITAKMKLSTYITNWLEVGLDGSFTNADYSGVGADLRNASIMSPYGVMYRDAENKSLEKFPITQSLPNPLWNTDESNVQDKDVRNNYRLNAYAYVKCPWVKGLSYRLNYSVYSGRRETARFYHENYYVSEGSYDADWRYSEESLQKLLSKANGSMNVQNTNYWLVDNILNYKNIFGKHSLDLTAVMTSDSKTYYDKTLTGSDFAANGNTILGYDGLHKATTQKVNLNSWKHTNVGLMGRINYAFNDRYFLTASYRRDGSSVFGDDNKWGNFYAFGGAWNITKESFMTDLNFLNNLKLKLSWGKNGNQGLSPYATLTTVDNGPNGGVRYEFGDSYIFYGLNQTKLGNSKLGWETTESFNTGFESAWLDNRLFIDLDVYFSKTRDQIFNRTIPIMSGFGSIMDSMGEIDNKGVEVSVRSVNVSNNDWNWTTNFTFWLNRNKVVSLYGEDKDGDGREDDDISSNLFIDKPLGTIYGYKSIGIVQETDQDYINVNGVKPGTPKYADLDGDGKITAADRTFLGCSSPSFKLNMSNTISYKNWDLYFLLTGTFGGGGYFQQSNYVAYLTFQPGNMYNTVYRPEYWTPENKNNKYPAPTFEKDNRFLALQSRTYIRLQDVTLSYTFDEPWMKKLSIANLKCFATAKNLFTISNWFAGDPELGSTIDSGIYPVLTSFSLGANIRF